MGEEDVRTLCVGFALVAAVLAMPGTALGGPPLPDPNFVTEITPSPCKPDTKDAVEKELYAREGWGEATGYERYPRNCRRIHLAHGPITLKPGQNHAPPQPGANPKPAQDRHTP